MKILVTGAAGFLGSHLALHHLKRGDQVLGIDNFCSSDPNSHHVQLIRSLGGMLVEGDVVENGDSGILGAFEKFKSAGLGDSLDLIYNFACPASPPIYQNMPILTMMTCVAGTAAVLDLADAHDAIVVHASTSEVYGDPEKNPQAESYWGHVNSYGPRSCYDEGKRAAEALCYDWLNTYQVDARLVRIFNTYGPHMDPHDGRVVSNFICQALRNEKLTLYGDGSQTRSLCYVDDLIRGIVAVGELSENPRGPINLGNPTEYTMKELATVVSAKVHKTNTRDFVTALAAGNLIEHRPLPVDDPTQRRPDISRAKELLGWEPTVTLHEGLDKTISHFRSLLNM